MFEDNGEKLGRYLPAELLNGSGKIRVIKSPKGKISSKEAFKLQRSIMEQLTSSSISPIAEPGRQMTYKK